MDRTQKAEPDPSSGQGPGIVVCVDFFALVGGGDERVDGRSEGRGVDQVEVAHGIGGPHEEPPACAESDGPPSWSRSTASGRTRSDVLGP